MIAAILYATCAMTAAICAVLLIRAYRVSKTRMLFWAGFCFACLAVNNLLVLVDERIVPATDLIVWRTIPALVGVGAFLFALIWDVQS